MAGSQKIMKNSKVEGIEHISTELTSKNQSLLKKKEKKKTKMVAESMESNEIYIDLDLINPLLGDDKAGKMTPSDTKHRAHNRRESNLSNSNVSRVSQCHIDLTAEVGEEGRPFKEENRSPDSFVRVSTDGAVQAQYASRASLNSHNSTS